MNSLLPPNSTKFELNFEQAFSRVSAVEIPTRTFNNPLNAPLQVLPFLAWEKSVDVWNKDWSDDQKRQTVSNAFQSHMQKGTIGALEKSLGSLGFKTTVQEWFKMQQVGKPYTFKLFIQTSSDPISTNDFKDLFKVVQKNKNLRSHLIASTLIVNSELEIYTASTAHFGTELEYSKGAGGLYLDGTWSLDGSKKLNGVDL